VADLSNVATELGFTLLPEQIKAHGHKFPVSQSTTWQGEDVHSQGSVFRPKGSYPS
jgi:hypothetical protein